MKYNIKFDRRNTNVVIINDKNGKNINYFVYPPIKCGIDIVNYSNKQIKNYIYDFDGLVIITTEKERKLYYKGELLDSIERIKK